MVRLGNNEALKTLTKILTFVDADANASADADAGGSTIALPERCSGELKTENICYVLPYFLHHFLSPFHQCLAEAISTDYAHFRAGQYTSHNGSKYVARVDHIES